MSIQSILDVKETRNSGSEGKYGDDTSFQPLYPKYTLHRRVQLFIDAVDTLKGKPTYPRAMNAFSAAFVCWAAFFAAYPHIEGKIHKIEILSAFLKTLETFHGLLEQVPRERLSRPEEISGLKDGISHLINTLSVLNNEGRTSALKLVEERVKGGKAA